MESEDLKTLDENNNLWLTEYPNPDSSSLPCSIPIIDSSKNTLKFVPNPKFAEQLVEEVKNGENTNNN